MSSKKHVLATIKKYKTRDSFKICNTKNIAIIYSELENDVRGIYQYYKRKCMIHLNSNLSLVEQRGVLAHEFGHVILHQSYNCIFLARYTYNTKDKYECQVSTFTR